jgi:phosphoribosyl 1,2-cyclic phosphate phosphodiesterase
MKEEAEMRPHMRKVTFTIMGAGSAYGVPTAGNGWGACDPRNPANHRLSPSILIQSGEEAIIIDMGPDFREQTNRHNVRQITGVLFTHCHADHIVGIYELPRFTQWQTGDINCFGAKETLDGIAKMFYYLFDPKLKVKYYGPGRINWHEIDYGKEFQVGSLPILPIHQDHGFMASTGFRVGDIAYSTDLKNLSAESKQLLTGLDVWLLDCNDLVPSAVHNHLEQALVWAEELKPGLTVLTHLSETIDFETVSKTLPAKVILAKDGMQYDTFVSAPNNYPSSYQKLSPK